MLLYLMNKKGYEALKALIPYKNEISLVISSDDPNVEKDYFLEIEELCQLNGIEFKHRKDNFNLKMSEYSLAIGWRWLIKNPKNLIVLHDSLLPKYRGFATLVNMLINGENKLGVTAILADEGIDTGPIILQKSIKVSYPIKIEKAIEKISTKYAEIIVELFEMRRKGGQFFLTKQDGTLATYSLWRDENDYFIDWNKPAREILRFIDAVGLPYMGAKSKIYDKGEVLIKIDDASIWDKGKSEIVFPGKILLYEREKPVICCGDGRFAKLDSYQILSDNKWPNKLRIKLY